MLDDGSIKTKADGKIEKAALSRKRPTQKHDQRKPWQPRNKKNANAASSTINTKAIEKAWVKSGKRTRNDDDDYIQAKPGPKSAKLAQVKDDDDVEERSARLAHFAQNIQRMGVKLGDLSI